MKSQGIIPAFLNLIDQSVCRRNADQRDVQGNGGQGRIQEIGEGKIIDSDHGYLPANGNIMLLKGLVAAQRQLVRGVKDGRWQLS